MSTQLEFTTCIVCQKPLGADSRDAAMRLCHEHRKCSKCEKPLNAREQQLCHDRVIEDNAPIESLEVIHPRCEALTHPTFEQDPTRSIKQSEYDYLNMVRLPMPDIQLSVTTNENNGMIYCNRLVVDMTFEEKLLFERILQAALAQCQIAVHTDPKFKKDALKEREAKHAKEAKKEALTSSRPVTKSPDDIEEQRIGAFMLKYGLTDRKTTLSILRDRDRAIQGFTRNHIDTIQAIDLVEKMMVKSGRLPAPQSK